MGFEATTRADAGTRTDRGLLTFDLLSMAARGVGVFDGLSARIASDASADFLWLSSFAVSAAAGVPDVGLVGAEEVGRLLRTIARVTSTPIVVDLDAGHGDPIRVRYVTEEIASLGAAAVCIEDNPSAKRCSLYEGYERELATVEEHAARVRAAKLGTAGRCAVIARTEALVAGLGVGAAVDRAAAYTEAGADAIFVQCVPPNTDELFDFLARWARRTAVFIAPTAFPTVTASDFFAMGATHVIYANQLLRAAHRSMSTTVHELLAADGVLPTDVQIADVRAVGRTVREEEIAQLERLIFDEYTTDDQQTTNDEQTSDDQQVTGVEGALA